MPDFSELLGKLAQTWPARAGKSFYDALMLPGDVYQGNIAMTGDDGHTNPEVINRAADLAGVVTGGSYAAPAMKGASGMGIRAYHGSPHDFDKFDLSKIGTGEGAQAYGHGLYFAENEGTAKSYRDALTRDQDRILENGGRLPPWVASSMESRNPIAVDDMRKTFQGRIAEAQQEAETSSQPWLYPGKIQGLKDVLQAIEDHAAGVPLKPPGRMYEVNINADPAHFLDWDKPIAGQAYKTDEAITDVLRRSGATRDEANYYANNKTGQDVVRRISRPSYPIQDAPGAPFRPSGAKSFDEAVDMVGGDKMRVRKVFTPDPAYTSQALNEAGIPGIKYLDQGSRAAGDGSRNYVLFNDALVNIIRKYGIAGTLGGTTAFSELAPQRQ